MNRELDSKSIYTIYLNPATKVTKNNPYTVNIEEALQETSSAVEVED